MPIWMEAKRPFFVNPSREAGKPRYQVVPVGAQAVLYVGKLRVNGCFLDGDEGRAPRRTSCVVFGQPGIHLAARSRKAGGHSGHYQTVLEGQRTELDGFEKSVHVLWPI